MRSTQFDAHFPFEEQLEEHRRRKEPTTLCEKLKRLGYAKNNQVRLYGEVFDLLSDPVSLSDDFVFVAALLRTPGRVTRIPNPLTIFKTATRDRRAA
jgi:hypothetical protein